MVKATGFIIGHYIVAFLLPGYLESLARIVDWIRKPDLNRSGFLFPKCTFRVICGQLLSDSISYKPFISKTEFKFLKITWRGFSTYRHQRTEYSQPPQKCLYRHLQLQVWFPEHKPPAKDGPAPVICQADGNNPDC